MPPSRNSDVRFSPDQLKYLESLFPHVVMPVTASEAALRQYFGTQSVIQAVKDKTRGVSAQNIPTPR